METREKIIELTFNLLLRKGYDGVSISDIQHYAGISRGLLYHYFGNKEALFIEAIKHKFGTNFRLDFSLVAPYDILQMTHHMVGKYTMLCDEILQGISIVNYDFLFYRAMQESKAVGELYQRVREEEQQGWLIGLRNSEQKGALRTGLNLENVAKQYIYVTDGVWMGAVSPDTQTDLISSLSNALNTLYSLIKH